MRRVDYIRQMTDEEMKQFIIKLKTAIPEYEWCGGLCPHVIENGCDIDVEKEICPYLDEDIARYWLEAEFKNKVNAKSADIILQIPKGGVIKSE